MAFQTGGEIQKQAPFQQGGEVAVIDPQVKTATPTLGDQLTPDEGPQRVVSVPEKTDEDRLMDLALQNPDKFFEGGKVPEGVTAPKQGFTETLKQEFSPLEATKKIPIIGGAFGAIEAAGTIEAARRLQKGVYTEAPTVDGQELPQFVGAGKGPIRDTKQNDEAIISDAFLKASKEFTTGGKIAKGLSILPVWMLEFAATGGLASLGDDAARVAGQKLLGKYVKTKAGKAALTAAGITAGAVVRSSTGLLPRVVEKAADRQALIEIGIKGQEGWATSFAKAWGDTVIESASEQTGEHLTAGLGALAKRLPFGKKFVAALKKGWMAKTGGTAQDFADKMLTKAGYSNLLGEYGEERLGTILREATKVSDREGDFTERIWEGIKEDLKPENILVEATVLGVPAAGRKIAGLVTPSQDIIPGEVEPEPTTTPEGVPLLGTLRTDTTPTVGEEIAETPFERETDGKLDEERDVQSRTRPGPIQEEQRVGPAKAEDALEEQKQEEVVTSEQGAAGDAAAPVRATTEDIVAQRRASRLDAAQRQAEQRKASRDAAVEREAKKIANANKRPVFIQEGRILRNEPGGDFETVQPEAVEAEGFGPETGEQKIGDDFSDFFDGVTDTPEISPTRKPSVQSESTPRTIRQVRKDARIAVENDEIFQVEDEAQEIRKRQVDVGVFFVPEKFKGEVKSAIESNPGLQFNVTFDKSKGIPFDIAVQEGFLGREGDATDKNLDISEFLDRVAEAKGSLKKIGGLSEATLSKMIASGNPFSEIAAVKHTMLHQGFTFEEINEAMEDIASEYEIEYEPLILKGAEDVGKSKTVPKKTQAKTNATEDVVKEVRQQEVAAKLARDTVAKTDPTAFVSEKTEKIKKTVSDVIDTDFTAPKQPGETSARQADVAEDREALGLDEINSKSRRGWETALRLAKKDKIPRKAEAIADEILAAPVEDMGDVQTAGLTIRMAELKKEHKQASNAVAKAKELGDIQTLSAEITRIEQDFDKLSRAVDVSGSEAGRRLAAQKLTINKNFDLISVVTRAKAAKGDNLTQKERVGYEKLTTELEKANTRIDNLAKEMQEFKARRFVRKSRAATEFKRMTKQQKDTDLAELVTKTNAMLKQGCNN